jgi:methane/ammonia monooxygenase subunit C
VWRRELPVCHDPAAAVQQERFSLGGAIVGPLMILPNVGLNEWGHAFWFVDELFAAPLLGLRDPGWCGLFGGTGVAAQIVARMPTCVTWSGTTSRTVCVIPY